MSNGLSILKLNILLTLVMLKYGYHFFVLHYFKHFQGNLF